MAFNNVTEWRKVEQLTEIKTSQKGNPQRGVRTEKGWITVRGANALLEKLSIGVAIEVGSVSEFKNPSTGNSAFYGQLMAIGDPPAPPPQQQQQAEAPAFNNGHQANGKVSWLEYALVAKAAHGLASELEPDMTEEAESATAEGEAYKTVLVRLNRSQARAAIVNTALIAFANGKLAVPEVDEGAPF